MTTRKDQRGVAALAVATLIAGAMLLAALFVNRHLLTDQRAASQQVRSAQAFEAAEAGLAWAIAQLDTTTPLGTDCRAAAGTGASFRERHLAWSGADGRFAPTDARPACVRTEAGWRCHCPASGAGAPAADADGEPRPGFAVNFATGARPGTLTVRATGCMPAGSGCGGTTRPDTVSTVEATLALLPGVAQPPAAALTVRDTLEATGALGVHNAEAGSGGIALQAGGAVQADALRLTAPPGASIANAFVATDGALAAATPQALFASTFGIDRETWRSQGVVRRVACGGECGDAIRAALGDGREPALLAIDGDLRVDGPRTIGTPARPVVLVVDGDVAFNGAVAVHGLVVARDLAWNDTPAHGAFLRGALLLSGRYAGNGSPDIARDAAVLDTLRRRAGSFVRLPGAWRDF